MLAWLRRQFLFRLLVVAPGILAGAYFALWACAPAATLPAPVPMTAERPNEIGISGSGALIPGAQQEWGASGAVHYFGQVQPDIGLGVSAFGGNSTYIGVGLHARLDLHESYRVWVALQPEVGWLYGGVGIPVGFRLSERAWLHLAPSVGYRLLRTVDVPFGLSYAGPKGLTISGEVAFAYGPETDLGLIGNVPNGRASFMLGYRFGPRKQ